jgi:hypothetical protein
MRFLRPAFLFIRLFALDLKSYKGLNGAESRFIHWYALHFGICTHTRHIQGMARRIGARSIQYVIRVTILSRLTHIPTFKAPGRTAEDV